MNRAERRRLEQKGVNKKTIMDNYCKEIYEKGFHNGMKHVEEVMFYMTAYSIQLEFNLGKTRLQRAMRRLFNNIDAFRTGHLTTEDFQTIKEEMQNKYGVNLL